MAPSQDQVYLAVNIVYTVIAFINLTRAFVRWSQKPQVVYKQRPVSSSPYEKANKWDNSYGPLYYADQAPASFPWTTVIDFFILGFSAASTYFTYTHKQDDALGTAIVCVIFSFISVFSEWFWS